MEYRTITSALCLLSVSCLMAGQPGNAKNTEDEFDKLTEQYESAMNGLVNDYDAEVASEETNMNPRLIRLFGKTTLYASSVSNALKSEGDTELYATSDGGDYLALSEDTQLAHQQQMEEAIDNAVLNASMMHPEQFAYTEKHFKEEVKTVEDVKEQEVINNIVPQITPQAIQEEQAVGVQMEVKKPNFWKTSGETYLQFQQNYISGNWSQGGESTNTLMSGLTLKANYNDQQKVQWDNAFEAKLGFTTAPSDKEHKYRTNADMLRLTSKLLLKAIRSWNYSFQVTSQTQSLRTYQANSTIYTSAFLAPLDTKVSIGMDYKKSWKNFNISINISPLTYRWLYIGERGDIIGDNADGTPKYRILDKYCIKPGHRSLQEYGSSTNINSSWQITKNISWTSHIDAFTSYEKMVANWENTFDFAVSKYLSTKLFFHGRFDDGVRKKDGYSYFQFKEYLQFGLSYKW